MPKKQKATQFKNKYGIQVVKAILLLTFGKS